MSLPLIPIAIGAFDWLKNSTLGRYAIAAAGVLLAIFVLFQRGKAAARKQQKIDDLEFGADIRRKTDEAGRKHKADMAQLPDDPDELRAALSERLRKLRGRGD
jgi:hypothetical protein